MNNIASNLQNAGHKELLENDIKNAKAIKFLSRSALYASKALASFTFLQLLV